MGAAGALAATVAIGVWLGSRQTTDWEPKVALAAFPCLFAAIYWALLREVLRDFNPELVCVCVCARAAHVCLCCLAVFVMVSP